MTKKADAITFDFDGTSGQNEDATNSTYVASWGQLFVALTSQLFWNIPWNGGMAKPVTLKIPEETVLNCRYRAAWACSRYRRLSDLGGERLYRENALCRRA